jgi:hypothetical protein
MHAITTQRGRADGHRIRDARARCLTGAMALFALLLSASALASEAVAPAPAPAGANTAVPQGVMFDAGGQVTLPLDEYQRLLQLATTQPLPAPSSYAVGQSVLNVLFTQHEQHINATVTAEVQVETFAEDWTLVPLLAPGAALESATADGQPVQLVQRAEGLFWLAEGRRQARLALTYHADARFAERAWIASLPIPRASATRFTLRIPQTHIDLAVAPVANLVTRQQEGATTATGTLPASSAMMVSWRVALEREYVLSRAEYSGALQHAGQTFSQQQSHKGGREGVIAWQARIDAELLIDGEVTVPLVSTATTLVVVAVDGEPATVFAHAVDGQERFAVRLAGAGKHRIDLQFLSAVRSPEGVPSSGFDIPDVPVSKFELRLPGDKVVRVSTHGDLAASVETRYADGATIATFHIPMSRSLALNWMEAIPADVDVERRANAIVYQALHAAEGVLYGLAAIRYEITRGEARQLEFTLPAATQVNQIGSADGAIADWIVVAGAPAAGAASDPGRTHIRVFLNRAVSGEFVLEVAYEQLLEDRPAPGGDTVPVEAPILRALDVARQKGMLALLAGPDLALAPLSHPEMSEVGENQLPAFFRNRLEQTVSHTFKYHSDSARLAVQAMTPERRQGKFNAQVDTLVSIGEVTLKGQVSIENDVKSGVLRELRLLLPADLNILGVTGPSIRTHAITPADGRQSIDIEFTREMDGQFRIELNYERIMLDGSTETARLPVDVPRVDVPDADVVQGRIAIEALAALEVQPAKVEQLSSLEIGELPRQLVLKTTNPILLAYRYVRTDSPFELQLRITRHEEIDVQVAAIDTAHYQTLYTADGLAVTRVTFEVRNSRRQFLRVALPPGSEIWSVFVAGEAEKPAFATDAAAGATDVLIKMINSATAFPVELVYATRGEAMHPFGTLEGRLPRPDMIVTRTHWDVYVPADPSYGTPRTNMDVLAGEVMASVRDASLELLRGAAASVISGEPLRIELPAQGLLFRFAKLYANQSDEDAHFSLRYVHRAAGFAGLWLSLLAILAIWAGIALLWGLRPVGDLPPQTPWLLLTAGTAVLAAAITLLGAGILPPSVLSLAIALGLGGWKAWRFTTASH